jgi:hypothetical protein
MVNKIEEKKFEVLPENFLKQILDASDREPQKSRAGTYKEHVHVSSLANNFCARQYAIALHEKLPLYESLTGGHKVTFRIGRAVEAHVRETLLDKYGVQNVYAKWECSCRKYFYEGLGGNQTCRCGKKLDIFAEPDIQDDHNGVKGHPDLVFKYKDQYHIVEIKSIKAESNEQTGNIGWNDLTAPLDSHISQAGFYPYLLSKKLDNVSPVVVYIYVTKDFKFGSPYKEYHVDSSQQQYNVERTSLLAEAKEVKDFIENKITPKRICATLNSPLAKKCPVAFRCFHIYDSEIR